MSQDSFPGLIRSGTSHSVSVSKHSGNAKNPKNIFHSEIEDKSVKKTSLDTRQTIQTNKNIQRANSGGVATNVQGFETNEISGNQQYADDVTGLPNHQEIATGSDNSHNRQTFDDQSLNESIQMLGPHGPSTNLQSIDLPIISQNIQDLSSADTSDHRESIEQSKISTTINDFLIRKETQDNVLQIPNDGIAKNNQNIGQKNVLENMQAIGISPSAQNYQVLQEDNIGSNHQGISLQVSDENRQPIFNGASTANNAKLALLPVGANHQGFVESSFKTNRQPTDNENLSDHFEVLPSDTIQRTRVELGGALSQRNSEIRNSSPVREAKKVEDPALVSVALSAQQFAKQKRDAFLGRLAGIKRDVGLVGLKLDAIKKI